jgi:hypothetical protein
LPHATRLLLSCTKLSSATERVPESASRRPADQPAVVAPAPIPAPAHPAGRWEQQQQQRSRAPAATALRRRGGGAQAINTAHAEVLSDPQLHAILARRRATTDAQAIIVATPETAPDELPDHDHPAGGGGGGYETSVQQQQQQQRGGRRQEGAGWSRRPGGMSSARQQRPWRAQDGGGGGGGGGGAVEAVVGMGFARDTVSPLLACIGSPCLRHCVHGASIGGEGGRVLWAAEGGRDPH